MTEKKAEQMCNQDSEDDDGGDLAILAAELHKANEWRRTANRINRTFMMECSTAESHQPDLVEAMSNITAAIHSGETQKLQSILLELDSVKRHKVYLSQYKYGKSILQLALASTAREKIFKTLRVNMGKEMKRKVALLRDDLGNNLLHEACMLGCPLIVVQQILASFPERERLYLVALSNYLNNNCLRMTAEADNIDVFMFLLKRMERNTGVLCKCVFEIADTFRQTKQTVGHLLATQTSPESLENFKILCHYMRQTGDVRSFIFQYASRCTIMHSLLDTSCYGTDIQEIVLQKMRLLLGMAERIGVTKDLLQHHLYPDDKQADLLCLTLQALPLDRARDLLQSQYGRKEEKILNYLRLPQGVWEEPILYTVAWNNDCNLLELLVCFIPADRRLLPFLEPFGTGNLTVLHRACDAYSFEAFNTILQYFDVTGRQRLLMSRSKCGNSPVLTAYMHMDSCVDAINYCLHREDWLPRHMLLPVVTVRNDYGWTILHLACVRRTKEDCINSTIKLLKSLPRIDMSAVIQHADLNGNTVLHLAALLFHPDVIATVMAQLKPHKRHTLLSARNSDALSPLKLCNASHYVDYMLKYLAPYELQCWTKEDIRACRNHSKEGQTRLLLQDLEREHNVIGS